jgi:hypothetical protein
MPPVEPEGAKLLGVWEIASRRFHTCKDNHACEGLNTR